MTRRIRLCDTTLYTAMQSTESGWGPEQHLAMARELARLGIDVIETGSPIASPEAAASISMIARGVKGPVIAVQVSADRAEIDDAYEAVKVAARPRLHIALGPKGDRPASEVVAPAREAIAHARRLGAEVQFSLEEATRTEWPFLVQIYTVAARAGATILTVPDTQGYTTPQEYQALIQRLIEHVDAPEGVCFGVRCQDDLGLAVANSLAGLQAGAAEVACSISGIGGRAGSAALEQLLRAIWTRQDRFHWELGISAQKAPVAEDPTNSEVMEVCRLESFQVISGDEVVPTATVRLIRQGGEHAEETASGNGPVGALYNAINRAAGFAGKLLDFRLKAVTGGQDALGEVVVRVQSGDRVVSGHGISADVVEASAQAYIDAINKILSGATILLSDEPAPGWLMRAWGD